MRLATYRHAEGAARLGVIVGDRLIDVARLAKGELPDNMQTAIENWESVEPILSALIEARRWPYGSVFNVDDVRLLAPIPRTRKNIFGIGLNYRKHVAESALSLDTSSDDPTEPVVFSKPATTIIGPGDAIRHDAKITQQLDWEVELAVIIGRTAKQVPKENALEHVFGYSVMIDISARDNRRAGQWIYSKGMDSYAPFGPVIVTSDEIDNPQDLDLWLNVNGVEKQRSNTQHMIFDVAHLISDLSQGITLEPGDVIATGTPEGVGAGRSPQEWMWPGDVLEAGVDGIGALRNPVVAV